MHDKLLVVVLFHSVWTDLGSVTPSFLGLSLSGVYRFTPSHFKEMARFVVIRSCICHPAIPALFLCLFVGEVPK